MSERQAPPHHVLHVRGLRTCYTLACSLSASGGRAVIIRSVGCSLFILILIATYVFHCTRAGLL
jgi:hypothetical protein